MKNIFTLVIINFLLLVMINLFSLTSDKKQKEEKQSMQQFEKELKIDKDVVENNASANTSI